MWLWFCGSGTSILLVAFRRLLKMYVEVEVSVTSQLYIITLLSVGVAQHLSLEQALGDVLLESCTGI
jgi:hypothetical protein